MRSTSRGGECDRTKHSSNILKDGLNDPAYACLVMGASPLQCRLVGCVNISVILFALCSSEDVKVARSSDQDLSTPVGRWKTVDDTSGKVTSVVDLWDEHGKLYGKIERLVNPDPADPDPRCVRCPGDLKDRPLVGLRILWNLTKSGDQWSGGQILDPDNGKVYKCSLELRDGGKKLKVHGFLGFSLLGRTEYWVRDE